LPSPHVPARVAQWRHLGERDGVEREASTRTDYQVSSTTPAGARTILSGPKDDPIEFCSPVAYAIATCALT
jgi:hypothetical protein